MRLIDRKDIENWSDQFDSKGYFPLLISRLVRSTATVGTYVDFPVGSTVYIGGWDGIVKSDQAQGFVPDGISLWELGTESTVKGKADEDYLKRTQDPEGYMPAESTFIFVTPHFWKKKDKWVQEKLADGKWKDIRVYDSSILAQWLDEAAAVSRWFSVFINRYPSDGIITAEEYWREWSLGSIGQLPPETITAGRSIEINLLTEFLNGPAGIKAVRAASKDEAIAFILAASKSFEEHPRERFFSRTLIIDTPGNFRSVRINVKTLNLIARFDEPQALYAAAADGHNVLVPLGPDDTLNQPTIDLPTIDRDGQIDGLMKLGINHSDAERFSREAGRDITILKRLLNFPQNRLPWLDQGYIRKIIPAMLIGRWNADKRGDHQLLEVLSGLSYVNYANDALGLTKIEESPLIKIGELYRLKSPLDIWAGLASSLTENDLLRLRNCFILAFKNGNPLALPSNEKHKWIIEFNKEKMYSSWAREGLVQSLILIGIYGNNLNLTSVGDAQIWVDNIIYDLFSEANGDVWISLDREMPLLAEAAPDAFLSIIEKSLKVDNSPIMDLFLEENGFLHKTSHHTGLLWALEGLAWLPEYFGQASLILAHLSSIDPGGQLSNRPFNSLVEIFKVWHFQTLASTDERIAVLDTICRNQYNIGWKLLITLLPESHGVAHPTHKMRWRVFKHNFNIDYTYQDMWDMQHNIIRLLLEFHDGSDAQTAQLIDKSVELATNDRNKVLELVSASIGTAKSDSEMSWGELRKILSHHRSHPETDWALPEDVLKKYQELYDALVPKDSIEQLKWLFDGYPEFPEGNTYDDRQENKVNLRRKDAVKSIIEQHGISAIVELSKKVEEPWSLGNALAQILTQYADIEHLFDLVDFNEEDQSKFIRSFIGFIDEARNIEWIDHFYKYLLQKSVSNDVLIKFLTSVPSSGELWKKVEDLPQEIRDGYWSTMNPWLYRSTDKEKISAIKKLISYRRFFTAIRETLHILNLLPSGLIVELLESAATVEASEQGRFDYHLEKLLDEMQKRTDIKQAQKIKLEWIYMPVLGGQSSRRKPVNLHQEMANSPTFFVEVLSLLYRPKNQLEIPEEIDEQTRNMVVNRADSARKLLNSWKVLPGQGEDNAIDRDYLHNWVKEVRDLASRADRSEMADVQIGMLLARFPEKTEVWPPEPISSLIEELDSDYIRRNFITQVFNNHGSSSRGPFDGGNIERRLASRFNGYAEHHKGERPKLSRLFRDLAKRYLIRAKEMDDEAERDRLDY